jgi:hypothetical protein
VNSLLLETVLASGQTIQLVQGNITAETTDAMGPALPARFSARAARSATPRLPGPPAEACRAGS